MHNVIFFHVAVLFAPLEKRMGLYLVYHWLHLGEMVEVYHAVGVEITNADRAQLALVIGFFHGSIGSVVVAPGLV